MARSALLMSLVKIAACKPNDESLASSNALSSESYVAIATTGPNTSFEHTFMSGLALVMTVGRNTPSSSTRSTRQAPSRRRLRPRQPTTRHDRARSCEISADTSVASSSGSPTTNELTWSTSAAVKSSAIELCT